MGLFESCLKNKKDLIRWQNLIFDTPSNHLHTTEQYLNEVTRPIFLRHLEMAKDCADLFQNTTNPEVFFSRYDKFIKECEFLIKLSEFAELEYSNIPEQLRIVKDKYDEIIIDLIDRMWQDTSDKTSKLKTTRGRRNRYQKFYDTLLEYESRMPAQCIQYYKQFEPPQIEIFTFTKLSLEDDLE